MQSEYTTSWGCTNLSQMPSQLAIAEPKCTIYRVHEHLRKINDQAYEPKVIAIGPYHHKKDKLKMMDDHKLRYLNLLLQRENKDVEEYVSAIRPLAQEACKCYADPITLDETEFINMLVLDGCFIIELVRKCNSEDLREKDDPIFRMNWIFNSLQRDLMLFENQIPFFVLRKLFFLIDTQNEHCMLIGLLMSFFESIYPREVNGDESNIKSPEINQLLDWIRIMSHEIKHLLDLIHISLLSSFDWSASNEGMEHEGKQMRFIVNATSLREANVKFERKKTVKSLFDISFKRGTMSLPPLTIEGRTESFLRNLIAYEQYSHDDQCSYVTDYVKFFDCLIDSSRDVEILSRFEIIDNWLGDDGVVADMFNKLTNSVSGPGNGFIYGKIFYKVNKHCNKRRNRWMAKLRRNHLNSPWAIISIIAAVVLLLLTVTQTVFSILQVVLK